MHIQVLDHNDNEGNEFDDVDWVGAFLDALGEVKVGNKEDFIRIVERIDRYLARDKVL